MGEGYGMGGETYVLPGPENRKKISDALAGQIASALAAALRRTVVNLGSACLK